MKSLFLIFGLSIMVFACKKDEASNEKLIEEKIDEIIPPSYVDTLIKMGMVFHKGANPPDIQGIYEIKPYSFVKSNIENEFYGYGDTIRSAKIYFRNQTSKNTIDFYSKRILSANDTTSQCVITGTGTKFSVYSKHTIRNGDFAIELAYIFSGEMADGHIKNFKVAGVNVKDINNPPGEYISEGQGRIFEDQDFRSDKADVF